MIVRVFRDSEADRNDIEESRLGQVGSGNYLSLALPVNADVADPEGPLGPPSSSAAAVPSPSSLESDPAI